MKTYNCVGTSCNNGVYSVRFANSATQRTRHLLATGHTDVKMVESSEAGTKQELLIKLLAWEGLHTNFNENEIAALQKALSNRDSCILQM